MKFLQRSADGMYVSRFVYERGGPDDREHENGARYEWVDGGFKLVDPKAEAQRQTDIQSDPDIKKLDGERAELLETAGAVLERNERIEKAPSTSGSFPEYIRDINLAISRVFNVEGTVDGAAESMAEMFGGNKDEILKTMQQLNITDEDLNQHGWVTLAFSLNLFEKGQTKLPSFTQIGKVVQVARGGAYKQAPQQAYQTWHAQNRPGRDMVSTESAAEGVRAAEDQEFVLYDWFERTFDIFGDDYGDAIEVLENAQTNQEREAAYQALMTVIKTEIEDDLRDKYNRLTEKTYEGGEGGGVFVEPILDSDEEAFVEWYKTTGKDGFSQEELEAYVKEKQPDRYAMWQHMRRSQILVEDSNAETSRATVQPVTATETATVTADAAAENASQLSALAGKSYREIKGSATLTRVLQDYLVGQGYNVGRNGPDGKYGPTTRNAVRGLQAKLGVKVDGAFGKETFKAATGSGAMETTEQRAFNEARSIHGTPEAFYGIPEKGTYVVKTPPSRSGRGFHANMPELYKREGMAAPQIGQTINGHKIYTGLQYQLVETGGKKAPAMQRVHDSVKEYTGVGLAKSEWAQAWRQVEVIDGSELGSLINTNRFIGNSGERLNQLKSGDPVLKLTPVTREVKDDKGRVVATARFQAYMREDCSNPVIVMDQFELQITPEDIPELYPDLLPEEVVGSESMLNLTPIILAIITSGLLGGGGGGGAGSKDLVNVVQGGGGGGAPVPTLVF